MEMGVMCLAPLRGAYYVDVRRQKGDSESSHANVDYCSDHLKDIWPKSKHVTKRT
jgi:hypothetical protein